MFGNEKKYGRLLYEITISIIISIIGLGLLGWHILYPRNKIDEIYYVLILIILLPWLTYWLFPKIKSLEILGVGKIETREITEERAFKVEAEAAEVSLIKVTPGEMGPEASPTGEHMNGFEIDPILALINLRSTLELTLKKIAIHHGLEVERKSIKMVARSLVEIYIIDRKSFKLICELIDILNAVAHGANIERDVARIVFEVAFEVITNLEYLSNFEA